MDAGLDKDEITYSAGRVQIHGSWTSKRLNFPILQVEYRYMDPGLVKDAICQYCR